MQSIKQNKKRGKHYGGINTDLQNFTTKQRKHEREHEPLTWSENYCKEAIPAWPSMNGRLDSPFPQTFRLRVLRASRGPPKNRLVRKLAGFLEKI